MNRNLVNTVSFHGTSPVYNVLNGTRKLRLMNKLNKYASFHWCLKIDRACANLFKPVARSRGNY